jgi:cell division protein DivIC
MAAKSKKHNVLAFRSPQGQTVERKNEPTIVKRKLHPATRRRRFTWLAIMVFIFSWALVQIAVQQFRIWDKQEVLVQKKQELSIAQQQTGQLKEKVKLLNDEKYLMELAHKLGYVKPEIEENVEEQETKPEQ